MIATTRASRLLILPAALALLTSACTYKKYETTTPAPQPTNTTVVVPAAPSTLTPAAGFRAYDLVDRAGYASGHIEVDAAGYGSVYDVNGNNIGKISPR